MLDRLIRFDIWLMVTFLGGLPGETMSAAAWNAHITGRFWGWTHYGINALFYFWQKDHCRLAWVWQQKLYQHA